MAKYNLLANLRQTPYVGIKNGIVIYPILLFLLLYTAPYSKIDWTC